MEEAKMPPPAKLLKKKCHCGEQLKFFSLIGVPQIPEWVGLGVYMKELEIKSVRIMPAMPITHHLIGMAFVSTCKECGNITAWDLEIEEVEYLLSDGKEDGYGIAWVYNSEALKEQFKDFPYNPIKESILKVLEFSDKRTWPPRPTEGSNG